MAIVYTSDLHGIRDLYLELFELATQKKAQVIIIGGDMLPIHGPFQYSLQEQEDFIYTFLEPVLRDFLSILPRAKVYAMLGNDDWQAGDTHLRNLAEKGILKLLHAERHDLGGGHELIGYGHVPPTPFAIKDGERRDLQEDGVDGQRCTACLSQGTKIAVVDPLHYFARMKSIEEELVLLPTPRDFRKTIYVMHSPPFQTNLDRLFDGRWIGSRAIRAFIERRQPYLTLHGHIHESSEISGTYLDRIGKTICINPGQSTEELYAVVFELENVFETIEHTVFGGL
ncbi:MAG: metallophosphoesterase [Syntrophobacterales bacterium]|jgi:Icc-related predicted phosphoesterase